MKTINVSTIKNPFFECMVSIKIILNNSQSFIISKAYVYKKDRVFVQSAMIFDDNMFLTFPVKVYAFLFFCVCDLPLQLVHILTRLP